MEELGDVWKKDKETRKGNTEMGVHGTHGREKQKKRLLNRSREHSFGMAAVYGYVFVTCRHVHSNNDSYRI